MKLVVLSFLLVAARAMAEEPTDRPAIEKTISRVGENQPALFTSDFGDAAELNRITAGRVVISKEPMGEAVWFPAAGGPRFLISSVKFVTGEVALVDALDRQNRNGSVLLVLKKEGQEWRVAAFKRTAEAEKTAP